MEALRPSRHDENPTAPGGADTELRHSMVAVVYVLSVHPSVEELTQVASSTEYANNHLTFPHNFLEF